jgi:transcription termination factor NusB
MGGRGGGGGGGSQRIDRHECRRKAVEFLMNWDDSRSYTEEEVDKVIARFVRQRPNGWDSLSYAAEILYGLLGPQRGLLIADRWIMGILAEDIQRQLKPGELSVLRWAAYELLNHPNIPTTVIINEANNIAKMFCPHAASLVHVAVNRMIETQQTIGAEVHNGALPILPTGGKGAASADSKQSSRRFPDLDPQAQLALMLMEQQRKLQKKRKKEGETIGDVDWLDEVTTTAIPGGDRGRAVGTKTKTAQMPRMVEAVRKNEGTQTEAAAALAQI